MKKIKQFQTILNVVIVFSICIMVISVLGLLMGLMTGNMSKMNVTIHGQEINHVDAVLTIVILLMATGYGFFIYSIYQLKKLIDMFIRKEFFTDLSVKTLRIIGVSMLASPILIQVPGYAYGILNSATIHLKISSISPESIAFSIIISLFFIILSYIFNEAKIINDENELTI
ncbi:hypothetical protein FNO01nite_09030 [Flavobacterium noncentrifugens]|uniref:DUF2975 domain-containing protein n=1 Tax=Flavobacterium noncentrifugens TaxID=1128970 RepID=A0A1G8THU2_9FLAO|nr:DUF2975 domain-containing protein [Flavobacterium noncentrifugens]GEP50231.1 hypothetical protein FNO01nite_09030 [Flavobacterium noncentrifugens]SDJ40964.1 Protein of unknown function [Flavobacterium noncentrifugens]